MAPPLRGKAASSQRRSQHQPSRRMESSDVWGQAWHLAVLSAREPNCLRPQPSQEAVGLARQNWGWRAPAREPEGQARAQTQLRDFLAM